MNAPRAPLKSLDQALAELLAQAQPLPGTEQVDTFDADGIASASAGGVSLAPMR